MTVPDIWFVSTVRPLEVEAIEGGVPSHHFTLAPADVSDEDSPVLGIRVDDTLETEERTALLRQYVDHARRAYRQRGLVYPFDISGKRRFFNNSWRWASCKGGGETK